MLSEQQAPEFVEGKVGVGGAELVHCAAGVQKLKVRAVDGVLFAIPETLAKRIISLSFQLSTSFWRAHVCMRWQTLIHRRRISTGRLSYYRRKVMGSMNSSPINAAWRHHSGAAQVRQAPLACHLQRLSTAQCGRPR